MWACKNPEGKILLLTCKRQHVSSWAPTRLHLKTGEIFFLIFFKGFIVFWSRQRQRSKIHANAPGESQQPQPGGSQVVPSPPRVFPLEGQDSLAEEGGKRQNYHLLRGDSRSWLHPFPTTASCLQQAWEHQAQRLEPHTRLNILITELKLSGGPQMPKTFLLPINKQMS